MKLHRHLALNIDKIEETVVEEQDGHEHGSLVKKEGDRSHLDRKKLFAQLSTLLALLGSPPDIKKILRNNNANGNSAKNFLLTLNADNSSYSEFISRMQAKSGIMKRSDEFRDRHCFYARGISTEKRSVVYYIARRVVPDSLDMDSFIYFLLNTLKVVENEYDLVIDWYPFSPLID